MTPQEKMQAHHEEMMQTIGWYAHLVPGGDHTPFGFNYHTHGFEETFKHLNLQICISLPQKLAHYLANRMVELIKDGKTFEPGIMYNEFLENLDVQFVKAIECGRPVLRMILPDKDNKFDTEPYNKQFTLLNNDECLN